FNTVRYLKVRQIVFQIYYRFFSPKLRRLPPPVVRGSLKCWHGLCFSDAPTTDGRSFTFLGKKAVIDSNWNRSDLSKLWLYNLHYQDYLVNSPEFSVEDRGALVNSWIFRNPPFSG